MLKEISQTVYKQLNLLPLEAIHLPELRLTV